jgi:uncharacterized membrane protein
MKSDNWSRFFLSTNTEQSSRTLEIVINTVYAVVMALLVLVLIFPENTGNLSSSNIFGVIFPRFFYFTLAFFLLATFWIINNQLSILVRTINSKHIRITFITLFIICLLPFTSSLAGAHFTDPDAVIIFHMNILILGLFVNLYEISIFKTGLSSPIPSYLFHFIILRSSMIPLVSVIAIIIAFFSPIVSSLCYLFLIPIKILLEFFKPDFVESKNGEKNKAYEQSLSIPIDTIPGLHTHLSEVSEEMGISKEELVVKILLRWKREMRVNVGMKGQLCQIHTDETEESSFSHKTDII